MKTIYIPKGETVRYDYVVTENLVVEGYLEVAYDISAKHISGGGFIHAQSVSADVIRADELDAGIVTCKRLVAKRVRTEEMLASESAAVSCHLSAVYVETGRLTVALSDIGEVKACEVINLVPKKRSLFGTLLASFFRAFCLSRFAKPAKSATDEVMDADYATAEADAPQMEATADAVVPEDFIPEDFAVEESSDFELKRIIAQFKLARESGYTLRLIPGTPEENAPVFPFEAEPVEVRSAA